ncbi:hypothetical protein [Marinovum sp.]|uniref:hypothetical protein n=1 Tax=Marinovum sp. TaxID=2024839 RepID=UPI003A8D9D75
MPTFSFTALAETDLTLNGSSNFFVGDTLLMPDAPTLTITVTDDDGSLSGDNLTSEQADDTTGQTATITDADGVEQGNGGQIYGEAYFWVSDSAGTLYCLIEIEQEGASGDAFAFHADYGVPAAGTYLTVESKHNVKESTILPDYADLTAGGVTPDPEPEPEPEPEPDPDPFTEYSFTAFNEFDLTMDGYKNLFVGHSFVMPDAPTLTITVSDDDTSLSGDNLTSEYADDETGQTGTVVDTNGTEVGNGAQLYAECFYWVSDAAGNRYMLLEIEQEGTPDDYFVFHTDYGVPEAGVELFVEEKRNVKDSTIIPDYADMTVGPMEGAASEWNELTM